MKQVRRRMGLMVAMAIVVVAVGAVLSNAQQNAQTVPLDRTAVQKTHVPHENPNMWGAKAPDASAKPGGGGGGGKPGGGGGGGGGGSTVSGYSTIGSTVTVTTTAPEAEEHIAVDPMGSSNMVAAISDFSQRGGWNTTKYAWFPNNQSAWSGAFVPCRNATLFGNTWCYPATSDDQVWEANSDPVVAIDRAGRVFLANLYFNGNNNAGGFYVSVGSLGLTDLGITYLSTYPVSAQYDPKTNIAEDKEWIAVDNTGGSRDGSVYASWTRFTGNLDAIMFSRSADHGQTWSNPLQISPSSQSGAVQGSQVAVGPDGTIYVVYEVFYVGSQRAQFFAKSTNGGTSFSTPAQITPLFGELKFNSTYRKNTFASLAVGPTGTIYVAYADQPKKGSSQVRFVYSTNGGSTFSSPISVNDSSTGQRLMPSVAWDSTGGIHVSWFDTRNGSGSTALYDIYAARSDDGKAFSSNQRVTGSTINAGTASFIGDYGGNAASNGSAHPVWTSGGFTNGRLQTATLTK
jgi:hypothetical protein